MRNLEHRANLALVFAVVALIPACILLGAVLSRKLEELLPNAGRALGYFLAFLLCPAVSIGVVILIALVGSSLRSW